VIEKHQWPFWSRALFRAFGGRFGDHRDWPVIDAWGDQIALALAGCRLGAGSVNSSVPAPTRTHSGRPLFAHQFALRLAVSSPNASAVTA
jgi:hypothetical protein